MKCPWLINTLIETKNRNSYNDSSRKELQEFGKCVEKECPFYHEKVGCRRINEHKPIFMVSDNSQTIK